MGNSIEKPTLWKNSSDAIKPIAGGDKGIHASRKGICPKVNVIARLEFEFTYFKAVVQYLNHCYVGLHPTRNKNMKTDYHFDQYHVTTDIKFA